jgi:hypothetical protein
VSVKTAVLSRCVIATISTQSGSALPVTVLPVLLLLMLLLLRFLFNCVVATVTAATHAE